MLGQKETVNRLAKANKYGHVSRVDSDDVVRRESDFKMVGKRAQERPKITWKRRLKKQIQKLGVEEDTVDRAKRRHVVR